MKFPNHENVSADLWLSLFPNSKEVSLLIRNDMQMHRVRAESFDMFLKTPNLITHIVVGLAELNSNAMMFGGFESTSFKVKYKNFDKFAGRALKLKMNTLDLA